MTLPKIAFIGGGNMATAIISGLLSTDKPPAIHVVDPVDAIRERHQANGCTVSDDPTSIADAGIVVLAVKPQMAGQVLANIAAQVSHAQVIISILAGTRCETIEGGLGDGMRVIRAMPNTPMAINKGMVGLCRGSHASEDDLALAAEVFSAAAEVLPTSEDRMDAITAVSGSGPAYLFHFCEAMQAAAMELGFNKDEADLLVGQTVEGSIAYLRSQDGFPAARLREQVTSPGGTTAAALAVFAAYDFPGMMIKALQAAKQRGEELSA